ncbi:MAG: hypothetical protein V1702_04800 [Candidatus Woesearchaeota archaeon]
MDLRQDAGEKAFVLVNGEKAHNVEELGEKLLNIGEQGYSSHANSRKNDFSNWVRDVYEDKKLADNLAKAKNPAHAAAVIKKRLAETAPRITTEVLKAPKSSHATVQKVAKPKVMEIKIRREKPKTLKLKKKSKKIKLRGSAKSKGGNFFMNLLKKKSIKHKAIVPDAHKFLTAYMSMQRPTVSHLYFSKGISDFMLGMTIGIVIGIILAHILI